jgi:TolB-like protein/Tfp pilus assembly protein PilF
MPEQGQMLSSWKEISSYLGRTVRTCQRLEAMGLPVHRIDGSPKAHVFAYPNELDAWLTAKVDEHKPRPRPLRRALFIGAGLVVVGTAAVVLVVTIGGPGPGPSANSIAVMPFDDLSPEPGSAHLAAGLTEDLTSGLARIHGFQVSGLISAAAVKGRKLDAREAGLALGVQSLLEGSVRVEGDGVIVDARLVRTGNGFQSWTESYSGPKEDYFDIREKIIRSVVEELSVILRAGEEEALGRRPTADIEAYDLYLKGRALIGRVRPEAPEAALDLLRQAVTKDPRFAPAYAGIALAFIDLQTHFVKPPAEAFPQAEEAAAKALALDPDLAEAWAADAWVKFQYKWDWEAAARSYQRALELKPSDALTRGMYSMFLMSRRRFEEARTEVKLALALDPLMPLLYADSMWIHMSSGRPGEVLEDFARFSARVGTDFEFIYTGAGFAYLSLGRIDEAEAMFERANGLPWKSGRAAAGLIACRLRKGDRRSAEGLYAKMQEDRKRSLASPVMLAFAAAALGDMGQAFEWLRLAEEERDPHMPFINVYAATFVPELAREPRFQAVLDRLGLPH